MAVLPGDGIGPEVVSAARRALVAVAEGTDLELRFREEPIGGQAIEAEGDPCPASTLQRCEACDAILLGAVGGPQWSHLDASLRPEAGLLKLRQHFGLFANLRPIRATSDLAGSTPLRAELLDNVDLLFVRELTGGLYFGPRQEETAAGEAFDTMIYSVAEVERVARVAFEAARGRRGKVTSVDKANVLASMRLWRRTVDRVAQDYPEVALDHLLVDNCAMQLLRQPTSFDVVLTPNLFGDILSDEAAVLAGSLGTLPSASLGASCPGLFEPVHGSAPDIAGRGLANPVGAIASAALLLRHGLGLASEARRIEAAVAATVASGLRTADLAVPGESPVSTDAFTTAVVENLLDQPEPVD